MKRQRTRPRPKTRARRGVVGALIATAALGTSAAEATVPQPPRSRYEAIIGDVIRTLRADQDAPGTQQRQSKPFDIVPGPLAGALASFEAVTGISVEVAAEVVRDIHSPGAAGSLTADQALRRLLAGTGLTFRFTSTTVVSIEVPGQQDFVEVTGVAPAVVSSVKATAPVLDTPGTVLVIPNQIFTEQGAQTLTDVLRNVPGITFNAGENGFVSGTANFSMRGFDSSGSVFVDGARDSGNYYRDVFNVEQVEVVEGPAADNGRSSAGGYVNLATKAPRVGSFTGGSFGYGFDGSGASNRPRLTFDVNQQLAAGAAVRLNALWQDGGVPGRDFAERGTWGVAPSVALGLDGPTRFIASYQHVEQEDVPDWGVPGALVEGMVGYNADAGGEANRELFYGHLSDFDDVTADAALARVEHVFSPQLRLSNQTRWSKTDREALYSVPTGYTAATRTVATQRQAYRRENTALTNLTNLAASFETGTVHHTLATGLEFAAEDSRADRFPTNGVLGNPGSTPVGAPDPRRILSGLVGLVPIQTADVSINTAAVYAHDTARFGQHWEVTGGVRLERYDVNLESRTAAGAPQGPDGYERTDTTVSGKVGVVFKPAPNGSIYGAVSSAALPPASYLSNPDISRDGDNAFPGWSAGQNSATSPVQRSTNYEVGAKWELFKERLLATVAGFWTERTSIAQAGTVNGVANAFAGYGEQRVSGVQLGASGYLTRAWALFGGLLFMDSERRHGPEVDAARLAANPADYGTKTTTNGDELAFTPNVTANLWTTYRLPFGLTVGGGVQHVGESFLGRPDNAERIIPNGNAGILPAYTVGSLMAAYEINRSLSLRFNVDNVTDEFYAVSSNWAGSRVTLGPPRSFLVSADVKF